jgi:hypothetical protein
VPVFPAGAGLTRGFSARALHGYSSAGLFKTTIKPDFFRYFYGKLHVIIIGLCSKNVIIIRYRSHFWLDNASSEGDRFL